MKEIINLNLPDYRTSLTIPEYGPAGGLLKSNESDYLNDFDALPTNDDLPPDHLTAMYWG